VTEVKISNFTAPAERFSLLSITRHCVNRGNLIIEFAARRALGKIDFDLEFDAYQRLTQKHIAYINRSEALVLPGATLLQPGDHAALESLAKIRVPLLAIGTALRSLSDRPDLEVARRFKLPIGSRDPFTHDALSAAGIPSQLVGCPTLLLGRTEHWRPRAGSIIFAPGLGPQEPLRQCMLACAELGPTIFLQHAPAKQRLNVDHENLSTATFDVAEQALALISSASVVVTSRIHAFLTALVHGVPALFLGPWYDSRYTLLEFLGVPMEQPVPRRIQRQVARIQDGSFLPAAICFERASELRSNMIAWLMHVAAPLGFPLTPADLIDATS
jgi:hypothetical protein